MANQFDKVLNQVVDAVAEKVGSNVVPVLKVLADHTELLEEVRSEEHTSALHYCLPSLLLHRLLDLILCRIF